MCIRPARVYGSYPATFPSSTKSGAGGPDAIARYKTTNHSSTKKSIAIIASDRRTVFQHFQSVKD